MTPPTHRLHGAVSFEPEMWRFALLFSAQNSLPGRRGHDPALRWRMEFERKTIIYYIQYTT